MATVIAEIGCNHKGSLQIALDMIASAAKCGADIAKFQKRNIKESLREEIYKGPHPNPENSYGKTYGEHREFLELSAEEHTVLKAECDRLSIEYSCTPFDITSAKEIASLNPKHLKISSFHNNHEELIKFICTEFMGTVHVSLGMTTGPEKRKLFEALRSMGRMSDTVVYWCTSAYPCKPNNLYLKEINKLISEIGGEVKGVGFSGHHDGIAMDMLAIAYGAQYIERHFTLDHNWKGTDHKTSLEPSGLVRLVRDIRSAELAMSYKPEEITPEEQHNRKFHKHQIN